MRDTEICSLMDSPKGCHGQSWDALKLRARSLFLDSHTGAGVQALEPSSTVFVGHLQKAVFEMEQLLLEPALTWDVSRTVRRLACYATMLAPV